MTEWFGNLLLYSIIWLSFGIWGIRKLLREHPTILKGLVSLAKQFFF
jgi:hypothetical protein